MANVIVPDINLLVYAYQSSVPQHTVSAQWLADALNGPEPVAFCFPVIWGFVRIITNHKLWPNPATTESALVVVREWLARPNARLVGPGPRHFEIFTALLRHSGVTGSATSDVVLAAIAVEQNATFATADRDFLRFPGLRVINPL